MRYKWRIDEMEFDLTLALCSLVDSNQNNLLQLDFSLLTMRWGPMKKKMDEKKLVMGLVWSVLGVIWGEKCALVRLHFALLCFFFFSYSHKWENERLDWDEINTDEVRKWNEGGFLGFFGIKEALMKSPPRVKVCNKRPSWWNPNGSSTFRYKQREPC